MSHMGSDLSYAFRALRRHSGFSVTAIITLALGIGATTAIFSVVRSVLLRPLAWDGAERIVQVWERPANEPRVVQAGMMPWLSFLDYRSAASGFEAMALYRGTNITFAQEDGAELVPGAEASAEFFDVFGAAPILGRAFTAGETRYQGPDVAVIGHGFWQERLGGRSDVIGSTLRLQGRTYEIIGVAPEGFDYPNGARIWLPVRNDDDGCGRGCYLFAGVGRLRPGVAVEAARAEMETVAARLASEYPRSNANTTADVASLRDVVVGDVRLALLVVFGAVLLLLLIACANVANLMLVRGSTRTTELAVRAVLGANRRRLIAQLVAESAVIGLVGTFLGLLLATWGVDELRSLAPASVPRVAEIGLDAGAVGFAAVLALVTIVLFGLFPALSLSRTSFAQSIREGSKGGGGHRSRGQAPILAVQVALSVALLLGAGLLLRSLFEMRDVDPGFEPANVAHFSFSLPDARYGEPGTAVAFVERVSSELAALPEVESAGFAIGMPFGRINVYGGFRRMDRPAPEPGEGPDAQYRVIDPDYLRTMGIPVLSGRGFQPTDRQGALPVALVNQTFVRSYYPGEDPIGRQIDISVSVGYPDTLPRTIVGVVGDVRSASLRQAPVAEMYVPQAQADGSFGTFVLRSGGEAAQVLGAARRVLADVDPELPLVRPGTLEELLAADTAQHDFYLVLIGLFAVLAVTLAAVGMYGVVAFAVARRTREIGVRIALGARAREVVSLVVWQGLGPAIAGAIVGIGVALATGRIMASLLFEVSPTDPLTILAVCAALLGVVALACLMPARRATRIPPAVALRE